VHAAQTAQTAAAGADVGQGRDGDAVVVADNHGFNLTGAMDQQADPAVELG